MAEISEEGGKGKKGKGKSNKISTKIDMTPMVDLAFLLITFFMLTTTFNKPQAMEVNMPDKNDKTEEKTQYPESETMTLVLAEENKIFYYMGLEKPEVKESNYSSDGIRKVLTVKNKELSGKLKIIIKAMEKSKYKNTVDILDEMDISTIKFYAIADITPKDLELVKKATP